MTKDKLKTEHWGEVDIDRQTFGVLLKLYKADGIAAIVKMAAHIGYIADVEWIHGYGEATQGDRPLAQELFDDLCELVLDAEQFDSDVNLAEAVGV
jgi:hypothetical protein